MLGPVLDPTAPPGMLRGAFILCAATDLARDLVQVAWGSTIHLQGDVQVKGSKAQRRILWTDVDILDITPVNLSTQGPPAQ